LKAAPARRKARLICKGERKEDKGGGNKGLISPVPQKKKNPGAAPTPRVCPSGQQQEEGGRKGKKNRRRLPRDESWIGAPADTPHL